MKVYTIEELAKILQIGQKQAKILMHTDGFPSIKIGGKYRVEESALQKWMQNVKHVKLDYSKC